VHRDLLEKIVVQLEIVQVDELAAVAPRHILRLFCLLYTSRCV